MDWCRINRNQTEEAMDVGVGLPGFAVSFGNYSFNLGRVYWRPLWYFVAVRNYAAFVVDMKAERRYLMQGELKEQKNEL